MLRVGILGCGHIAETMARTLCDIKEAELYAVSARELDRAEKFREKWNAEKAYGSYEELVSDENVDLIYVATLMSQHRDHMMLALEHGKNVLCEKSFTVNRREAEEVIAKAREKKLYLAEAIWTRYMPSYKKIKEMIDRGDIGQVRMISANLCYPIAENERIRTAWMGGGALLDIGVYPLNFVRMFTRGEKIGRMAGLCTKNEEGVDMKESIVLETESGIQASIFADTTGPSDRRGTIYGTKGAIEVDNINNPEKITVYSNGHRKTDELYSFRVDEESTGFEFEVREAARLIAEGKTESESMSLDETLYMMGIMDSLRKSWGIRLGSELEDK